MVKKKRATLQDIANRVGVTKMTVSRFLRAPHSVSSTTRTKIAAAVEELGYIQNRAPAMLSKSLSKAIGVVIPSLSNQVFATLVQGIEHTTGAHGYDTLIAHTGYSAVKEEEKIAMLLSYQVDGLILSETNHTTRTLRMLERAGIPVVETMELPDTPVDMAVGLNHANVAYEVVTKMLTTGRRNIVYLAARLDTRTRLRQQGYERAMTEAGQAPMVIATEAHSSFTLGGTLLQQALTRYPQVDGIFCTNDDIAVGAMMHCKANNIDIPHRLSVVGYNALDIGQAMTPKLTSVATPRFDIGVKSAELIIAALNGDPPPQKSYDLGYTLTAGESL
ncbi:LacI family DNA-binding transcriptional regulator [Alteromonas pelagimontana]|uniref:LacI family DNA-binding transcriptional regulator n=2 Tax=Alteromonas pelagimontana TaxID=1858656 RepID=A0A6M4MJP8_9ALTE|nr:LacI family DNA-binding transcriptional regulator [Alteromonas pelagimontana]QJR82810.1 LacI family DNA-binding transcriptional regulator [Alteromonas pelagimontana]